MMQSWKRTCIDLCCSFSSRYPNKNRAGLLRLTLIIRRRVVLINLVCVRSLTTIKMSLLEDFHRERNFKYFHSEFNDFQEKFERNYRGKFNCNRPLENINQFKGLGSREACIWNETIIKEGTLDDRFTSEQQRMKPIKWIWNSLITDNRQNDTKRHTDRHHVKFQLQVQRDVIIII